MAIQKLGAAMPTTAKNLPIWSKIESRLIADRIPSGYPHYDGQDEGHPG